MSYPLIQRPLDRSRSKPPPAAVPERGPDRAEAVNGVATFPGLALDHAGERLCTFEVSGQEDLTPRRSVTALNVAPAAATQLVVIIPTARPASPPAGNFGSGRGGP